MNDTMEFVRNIEVKQEKAGTASEAPGTSSRAPEDAAPEGSSKPKDEDGDDYMDLDAAEEEDAGRPGQGRSKGSGR